MKLAHRCGLFRAMHEDKDDKSLRDRRTVCVLPLGFINRMISTRRLLSERIVSIRSRIASSQPVLWFPEPIILVPITKDKTFPTGRGPLRMVWRGKGRRT